MAEEPMAMTTTRRVRPHLLQRLSIGLASLLVLSALHPATALLPAPGLHPPPALASPAGAGNPHELGTVTWLRDWDMAATRSRADGRPLFVLFQEVPGCATCVGFGQGALSNPRLVEAIETLFVPLAIHNNKPGADKQVLDRFGEPAWNNPVVRFTDADGNDWIPRKDGVWSEGELVRRMVSALEKSGRAVPAWLRVAADEIDVDDRRRLYLSMHCFWEGEARLGAMEGVLATRAGFLEGREVVEVTYDAGRIEASRLVAEARQRGVTGDAWESLTVPFREAPTSDQKRHLAGTRWEKAPDLTPLQSARINSALADGKDPSAYLTPRQAAALK
jgi:hypothetical protein